MSNSKQILVVDDDASIRVVTSELLQLRGFDVRSAATGNEGLALARELRPALVLLDVRLPDLGGHEVCRQIKTDPTLQDVFVVLISGEATSTSHKVEGLDVGADEYLTKPITGSELVVRVRSLLRLRNALAAHRASEATFRALFDNTPDGIVIADLQTKKLIQCNAAFSQMLGYAGADIPGLRLEDLHPADSAPQVLAQIERIARRERPLAEDIPVRHKDGTVFLAEIRTFPVTMAGTEQLAASFRDITERQRAERQRLAFSGLAHRLSAASTPQQAGESILEVASTLFGWDAGYVHTYSAAEDRVAPVITFDTIDGHKVTVPAQTLATEPSSLVRFVLREGAQLINRREEVPASVELRPFGNKQHLSASLMFAPIRAGGKSVGLLSIQSYTPSVYSPEDLKLLQALADHCGAALRRITITDELRAVDARYRSIVENATEGIFQSTPEGRFRSANPAQARMLGYQTPEELIARTTDIGRQYYVAPDRRTELKQLLETHGYVQGFEYEACRQDGSRIWVNLNAHVVRDEGGVLLYYEGISEDITERKQAQIVLHESEERFRTLFESAPIGIALHDAKGHYLQTNRAYQQMLGYAEEELKRLGAKGVTHPDDVAEGQRLFGELRAGTRSSYQRNKRYWSRDGRLLWAESSASAVRDHSGRLRFIISMVEDITGRRQAEDQIRLLVNAVHSTQELICITDQENRFQFVNRAFLEACGYSEQELLGRPPDLLYAPANAPGLCHRVHQQTLGGGWQGEIVNRRKDGTEFPIALNTSQITDGAGRVLGLVGVARDISEQQRAEKQRAAFALLGHRLSGATTPAQAADIILEIASGLFGWDAGYVHQYLPADDKIIPVLTVDTLNGHRTPLPSSTSPVDPSPLMRAVLKEGWRLVNRTQNSRAPDALEPFGDTQRRSASMMYVPIHARGIVLGILSIQSYTPHAYSERDLQLLQTLADHCGDALLRIQATKTALEAETKYRAIFENANEGIFQISSEDRYRSANPALARMLGYQTPEELISNVTNIGRQTYVVPEQREELNRLLEAQGSVQGFEVERYRKDGSKIWLSLNAHVVRDASGAVLYCEGTSQDITGRKRAEASLRESEAQNRALISAIPDLIFTNRRDGEFLAAHAPDPSVLFVPPETFLHRRVEEILPKSIADQFMKSYADALDSGAVQELNYALPLGGQERHFEARVVPSTADTVISIVRDITERKLAEAELRRLPQRIIAAQEAERLRVARELHDGVNQLLASAKMRLRTVEEHLGGNFPAAREILKRCSRLLVQALEENRRIAHDLRPSDLDELGLASACRNLCQEFQSRTTVVVRARFPREWLRQPPTVELNLFRIAQEVLANVEKHAQAKTVRLRLAVEHDVVMLRIQDDGRGMEAVASKAAKKQRRGSGLTNLRERATLMGGTCELVSGPKQGTTITVRVPCSHAK